MPRQSEALTQFRQCVLEAYRPLLHGKGFVEVQPRLPGNEFTVALTNSSTIVQVQGIHYGAAAHLSVYRRDDTTGDRSELPIYELLSQRLGSSSIRRRNISTQEDEIREDAANLLAHAPDVLAGDFTELERLAERRRSEEQERRARAPSPEQRAANVAMSEAGHLFHAGRFDEVAELLHPHLDHLPPSQRRRYEFALQRSRGEARPMRALFQKKALQILRK